MNLFNTDFEIVDNLKQAVAGNLRQASEDDDEASRDILKTVLLDFNARLSEVLNERKFQPPSKYVPDAEGYATGKRVFETRLVDRGVDNSNLLPVQSSKDYKKSVAYIEVLCPDLAAMDVEALQEIIMNYDDDKGLKSAFPDDVDLSLVNDLALFSYMQYKISAEMREKIPMLPAWDDPDFDVIDAELDRLGDAGYKAANGIRKAVLDVEPNQEYMDWESVSQERLMQLIQADQELVRDIGMIRSASNMLSLHEMVAEFDLRSNILERVGEHYNKAYGIDLELDNNHFMYAGAQNLKGCVREVLLENGEIEYHLFVGFAPELEIEFQLTDEQAAADFLSTIYEEMRHKVDFKLMERFEADIRNNEVDANYPFYEHVMNSQINYQYYHASSRTVVEEQKYFDQYLEETAKDHAGAMVEASGLQVVDFEKIVEKLNDKLPAPLVMDVKPN